MKRLIFLCKKLFCGGKISAPKFSQILVHQILQKVRQNIPQINKNVFSKPLKITKPFFVEDIKKLDKAYAKSLFLANLIFPFELIIFYQNKNDCFSFQKLLPNAKFLNQNLISKTIKNQIFSLNTNFAPLLQKGNLDEGIFCNGEKLCTAKTHPFAVEWQSKDITFWQTYFNGHFFFLNNKKNQKINIFIKKIIYFNKFKYFLLKKEKNFYFYDINTSTKIFVLCNEKLDIKLWRTKCGKGYNISIKITSARPNIALYIGKEKINVWDKDLKIKIFALANNQFLHKIKSNNKKLEFFFNNFLPKAVLRGQIFGKFCKVDLAKIFGGCKKVLPANLAYMAVKNCLVKRQENYIVFGGEGLKDLTYEMLFRGKIKTINFFAGAPKIVVGGVEYYGFKTLTNEMFDKVDHVDVFS